MNWLFSKLVEAFESHPRWWMRAAAAGSFGLVGAILVIVEGRDIVTPVLAIATVIALTAGFLLAGIILAAKDALCRRWDARHAAGGSSRRLLRLGVWWLLWIVMLLGVAFLMAAQSGVLGR